MIRRVRAKGQTEFLPDEYAWWWKEVLEQEDYIRAIDIRDEINKRTAQKKS